jgi:hypothetical protein
MATNAFLLIDCFGLVFLVYALMNFWNEWRRHRNHSFREVSPNAQSVGDRVATIPQVFLYTKNAAPVIPFPARYRQLNATPKQRKAAATVQLRVIRKKRASRAAN